MNQVTPSMKKTKQTKRRMLSRRSKAALAIRKVSISAWALRLPLTNQETRLEALYLTSEINNLRSGAERFSRIGWVHWKVAMGCHVLEQEIRTNRDFSVNGQAVCQVRLMCLILRRVKVQSSKTWSITNWISRKRSWQKLIRLNSRMSRSRPYSSRLSSLSHRQVNYRKLWPWSARAYTSSS